MVTVVSLVFALLFFSALAMLAGPLRTRQRAPSSSREAADGAVGPGAAADDDDGDDGAGVGVPVEGLRGRRHGEGWALHIDVTDVMEHDVPERRDLGGGEMELQDLGGGPPPASGQDPAEWPGGPDHVAASSDTAARPELNRRRQDDAEDHEEML